MKTMLNLTVQNIKEVKLFNYAWVLSHLQLKWVDIQMDRKCFWCKDSIEDEFHFVCKCTLHSDLRISLFNSIQVEIGNTSTVSPEE